jgi:hypothetical protein
MERRADARCDSQLAPPASVPATTRTIASETFFLSFFSALTMVHCFVSGVEMYWSTSTPIALMPASHAACRTPGQLRLEHHVDFGPPHHHGPNALPPEASAVTAASGLRKRS